MDDDNCATVLESFLSTLSLQVTQVNTKKVSVFDHFVLVKKWGIFWKSTYYDLAYHTAWYLHSVAFILV